MRKLITLAIIGMLLLPVLSEVDAVTYSGRASVPSKYRYCGFVPEIIYIKTNQKWSSSVFSKYRPLGVVFFTECKVKIYEKLSRGWTLSDSHTFRNTVGITSYTKKEFSASVYSYFKGWWVFGTRYVAVKIRIPKTHHLYFHSTFPTKIEVTLKGYVTGMSGGWFAKDDFVIKGTSKAMKIRHTPLIKYLKYWGISLSTTELQQTYNQLNQTFTPYESTISVPMDAPTVVILASAFITFFIMIIIAITSRKERTK